MATIKATGEQTGGRYSLVEILVPEGDGVYHVHHLEDEGFYILEGEMTFYVGEQTIKAQPGSFLFGPRDVPQAFRVDSGPARLLFIFSPAALEDFIRESSEPARSLSLPPQPEAPPDPAEMERLVAIAARYGEGDPRSTAESVGTLLVSKRKGGDPLIGVPGPSRTPNSPECVDEVVFWSATTGWGRL